jgi:hypothetical protein
VFTETHSAIEVYRRLSQMWAWFQWNIADEKRSPAKGVFPCNYRNVHCSQRDFLTKGNASNCNKTWLKQFWTDINLYQLRLMILRNTTEWNRRESYRMCLQIRYLFIFTIFQILNLNVYSVASLRKVWIQYAVYMKTYTCFCMPDSVEYLNANFVTNATLVIMVTL